MAAAIATSYPSLTKSWVPDSSCVASTGFWYVVYAPNVVFSNMFGMPSVTNLGQKSSPTGGCVPPSYTLSVPYLTDGGCPTNYYAACSTGTSYGSQSAGYIMCCPSVSGWNFECAPATADGPVPYGCQATFTSGAELTGSRTDLIELTAQAETHTVGGDHGVNAWGIALLSTPSQTSSTTSASSSTSGTSSSSSSTSTSSPGGLSTGASVGIGVGVALVACAIIGLLGFWLLRRRKKTRQQQQQQQQPPVPQNYHDGNQSAQNAYGYYGTPGSQTMSPNMGMKPEQQYGSVPGPQSHELSSESGQAEIGTSAHLPQYHEMPS
ncbi:hypothetical protein GQ53DRAFT_838281 [Thozetella sp. PMI_491]|nr:hypothetical protein GQ53DRAFT_838281 [Thozetella sp. PMI_491]